EGDAGTADATFTVSLSAPADHPVTVSFTTEDGTATAAGGDYVPASGTVTFAPGETTRAVTVPVNGDTTYEADEDFFLRLTDATGADLPEGGAVGVGTVVNDDFGPALSIDSVALPEGTGVTTPFTFHVTLSAPAAAPVTVHYATQDLTALAGSDYAPAQGDL